MFLSIIDLRIVRKRRVVRRFAAPLTVGNPESPYRGIPHNIEQGQGMPLGVSGQSGAALKTQPVFDGQRMDGVHKLDVRERLRCPVPEARNRARPTRGSARFYW
jgi:hypothetical protein